ncbi:hypothetical protein RCH10_002171 [Variovorax sp. GrIS 2.14]|uniref:hypothetical protein n=1 Tax=Variovorax sp. GrIS 2.14 TaxID=3071709 RepID=UPI0038F7F4E1
MRRLRPLHRFAIAFFVMVSVVFSQMALASYVCPGMDNAEAMAQAMADGAPCEGMDTAQPVLCHQHAADASQSFEKAKAATPSLPAVVQVLVVPPLLLADVQGLPLQSALEPRAPPDPVFLATRRLRV